MRSLLYARPVFTLCLFGLLCNLTIPATAAVIRVHQSAAGPTHDGATWQTAYLTIVEGLKVAQPGDEVWVAAGFYKTALYLPPGVSLYGGFAGTESSREQRAGTAGSTVLDGTGGVYLVFIRVSGTRLDGFVIRNAIFGIDVSAEITDIVDCTITNNTEQGIWVHSGRARVTGCTISGNPSFGISADSGTVELTNSIIAYNSMGVRQGTGTVTLRNCNAFGNTLQNFFGMPDPTGSNGNISVDPKLTSPYSNVHLQPDSPCIDAGDDAAVTPGSTDVDGQPRIQGAHVDIGSDESDGTLWPDTSRVIRVSMAGNDTNDGSTWALAKRTVAAGLASAREGDEVWVANGLYREMVTVLTGVSLYGGFAGTETSLGQRDWEAHSTTMQGDNTPSKGVIGVEGLGVTVDGFILRNGGAGLDMRDGSANVSHCVMTLNRNGISGVSFGALTLTDCAVFSNTNSGISIGGGTIVRNSTITLNTNNGVIVNASVPLTIANSIVAYNTYNGVKAADPRAVLSFSHNNVFGNGTNYMAIPDPTGSNGNISVAPLFFNQPGGNLRLAAGSPCINAGDDASVAPGERDLDGKPRRIGAHVDMGAYEFGTVFYTVADAAQALRIVSGQEAAPADINRLDLEPAGGIDLLDATRLIRKAAGLDANP